MARILTDTFEIAPTGFVTSLLRWSVSGNVQIVTTPVLDGTKCCNVRFNAQITNALAAAKSEVYIGFYFRRDTAVDGALLQLKKAGTVIAGLYCNVAGNLYVKSGAATVATSSKFLNNAQKYHISFHLLIDASVGKIETRIDDVTDISFTGNTKPTSDTTVDQLFFNDNGQSSAYYDNIVMNDTSTGTNNSWPGIRNFVTLTVLGPGFYNNNWSRFPASGANYDKVAEIPNDGDTTYLFTTSASVYESFSMSDQALSGVTYDGLLTTAVCRK